MISLIDNDYEEQFIDCHNNQAKIEFFKNLPSSFENIKNNCLEILSIFGSQYICEQFFSLLHYRKNKHSSNINQINLVSCLRIACSNNLEPNYDDIFK